MKADEGMWMLPDLKVQNETAMMELGLQIPVEAIYSADSLSIKDAVVQFGGGCTGEVISSEGLVLTNHHCGYSYIQQHSSVDHDYLTDGFWAMSRQEELPCKGLSVTFIDQILDVTGFVQEQLKQDPDPQGTNYLSPKYLSEVAKRFARQEGMMLPQGLPAGIEGFLWRKPLLSLCQEGIYRHPHGRRSSLVHRQVRSRYGQLDVASPYGRLQPLPHLCQAQWRAG